MASQAMLYRIETCITSTNYMRVINAVWSFNWTHSTIKDLNNIPLSKRRGRTNECYFQYTSTRIRNITNNEMSLKLWMNKTSLINYWIAIYFQVVVHWVRLSFINFRQIMAEQRKRQRTESMIKLSNQKKESKLRYEEAMSHIKSGNLEKAILSYNKVGIHKLLFIYITSLVCLQQSLTSITCLKKLITWFYHLLARQLQQLN